MLSATTISPLLVLFRFVGPIPSASAGASKLSAPLVMVTSLPTFRVLEWNLSQQRSPLSAQGLGMPSLVNNLPAEATGTQMSSLSTSVFIGMQASVLYLP